MTDYKKILEQYKPRFYPAMTARLLDEEDVTAYEKLDELLVEIIHRFVSDHDEVSELVVALTESGEFGGTGEPTSITLAWHILVETIRDIVEE